jgi:hypothetical protein
MTKMSGRRGLPCPPSPTTHSVLCIVPRCPRCMPYFLLSHFVLGVANVRIFLLRILVALFSSEANLTNFGCVVFIGGQSDDKDE